MTFVFPQFPSMLFQKEKHMSNDITARLRTLQPQNGRTHTLHGLCPVTSHVCFLQKTDSLLIIEGGETNGMEGMDQPAMEALVNPVEDEEIGWI